MDNYIIVKMKFGSHLYGTNTANSDLDYKGVFMPNREQIYLGTIPKSISKHSKKEEHSKNTKDDVDYEFYSLHKFIKLALKGETVALDMLHAPEDMLEVNTPVWEYIVRLREKFYTKNLTAFVGYARRQASKYGIKGSRLRAAKNVIEVLDKEDDEVRLKEIWDKLPDGEHINYRFNKETNMNEIQVCGRYIQETVKVGYAKGILQKFYDNYGKRARLAEKNEGIDWKALSHALRCAFETRELLTEKNITFPLKQADYLKQVKNGELDYKKEVAPKLEELMSECEQLAKESDLPLRPNKKFWDRWLIMMCEFYLRNKMFYTDISQIPDLKTF